MEHFEVSSSKIASVAYDKQKEWLFVYFKNGHTYRFKQVPPSMLIELLNAPSIGKYFYNNINDVFPYDIEA